MAHGRWRGPAHKRISYQQSRRGELWVKFFVLHESFDSRVKFIRLYRTVSFTAIWDFSFWGESDLWSDVWSDGVVCLSILLEGGAAVSNNFTKRRQNGFKIGTIETRTQHIWGRKILSQITITQFFYDRWFSYTVRYIFKLSHIPRIFWMPVANEAI